jgi:uncharacterized protein
MNRHIKTSGIKEGQRRLNGPQTTGRDYHNLSEARFAMKQSRNIKIPMRDGTILLVDIWRPKARGAFPALLAASPYPRQLQDLGVPAGFIEAGATDFWVPRGYVHVILNLRGAVGSGGEFGLFDAQERRDLYDTIEWIAAQSWCDGNVGMLGISYFAMTQMEAATQKPPHLKALFPFDLTADLWDAAQHNGLYSSTFITPWLSMLGIFSAHTDRLYRSPLVKLMRRILRLPRIYRQFATSNGEGVTNIVQLISRAHHADHPWNDLWLAAAVEHPVRDEWWEERNLLPLLAGVDIPIYLGSEWPNVPLHLPSTFTAWDALAGNPNRRMSILGEHGLTWPWESMHIEALAWFDHWLKGRDTGILDGPVIRYWLPGAEEWRTSDAWPPEADYRELMLNADGNLDSTERNGTRQYVCVAPGMQRSPGDGPLALPDRPTWTTAPLDVPLDVVGHIELRLIATATAIDTAWIVLLEDVAPDGTTTDVTQGWLRASLRDVNEAASTPGRPVLDARTSQAVPVEQPVTYRIPLVATARRFNAGHCIRLTLTSDDTSKSFHTMNGFKHTPIGTSTVNTVHSTSHLLLPILKV